MLNDKSILVIIPARLGGYRFPDKPLALEMFVNSENCYYEKIESVDMMRFVEYGKKVKMIECTDPVQSVDCQEDLLVAEKLIKKLFSE